MVANPMQKMKRNATLIGAIIGLVIGLIMCVILYLFLTSGNVSTGLAKGDTVTACVLTKSVKSGAAISASDIVTQSVSKSNAPTDVTTQVINGVAKIDLSAGTVLGASMLNTNSDSLTDDLREQEYNMIVLPTQLTAGDFIDIRLQLPNGGDYIVVSRKQVLQCTTSSVLLNMKEEEIDLMSNAIIEYYIMKGSKLYATTYVEPGLQTASVGTYFPNAEVSALIARNPNIKSRINSDRYSESLQRIRNENISTEVNKYADTAIANIEESMQSEINALKESRESYFGALNSASK